MLDSFIARGLPEKDATEELLILMYSFYCVSQTTDSNF